MAFPKKGSRTIVVDGINYLYRVSKIKKKSDWRSEDNELDSTFKSYAKYYGLGSVKDATINIAIQLKTDPVSAMYIKFHTLIVAGFMGPEQILEIKPNQVAQLIQQGLNIGWNPNAKGDFRLELAQKYMDEKKPVILQLPNMNETVTGYENLDRPVEIELES